MLVDVLDAIVGAAGVADLGLNAAVIVIGPVRLVSIAGSEYPGLAAAAFVNEPPPAETVHATLAALPSVAVTTGEVVDTTVTEPVLPFMAALPVVPFITVDKVTTIPT